MKPLPPSQQPLRLQPAAAFFVFLVVYSAVGTSLVLSVSQDGLFLLQARAGLDDPQSALSNWDSRDATPCNWTGVSCSAGGGGNVTGVDFTNFGLVGPFPSSLCRLPQLSFLSLSFNYINSSLLPTSLSSCSALTHLDLSQNLLTGLLPDLDHLPSLLHLNLAANNFSGPIPPSYGRLRNLRELSLVANLLNGTIPAFLGDLFSLQQLNLSYNAFSPGPIPSSFGNLQSLNVLWLAGCNLHGAIPSELGQLANLTDLDLSNNALSGEIPTSITNLTNVVQIELYNNSLSGPLPAGLSKLLSLRQLDASMNKLWGLLPGDLFDAPLLENLHLYTNQLSGPIPAGVARAKNLAELRLFNNRLNGSLPPDFGKVSPLIFLDLSDNLLSGEIPSGICDSGVLEQLLLINNQFEKALPAGLGRCKTLSRVRLSNNRFSGHVPDAIWALPHVWLLELSGNSFSGSISPVISGAANLSKLIVSNNQFSGSLPTEIGMLSNLFELSAANNRLTGPLPASLGSLSELGQLDLHSNSLSGELLRGIQSWKKLSEINLANNGFTGSIPAELGDLPVLNYLDLSNNLLAGEIPIELQNLKLNQLNLSNNHISGTLPPLFATDAYRDSFLGNPDLCRDVARLCRASGENSRNRHDLIWVLRCILILAAVIMIVGVAWFQFRRRLFMKARRVDKSKWTLTSFHKLGFSEYEILDCLDEDNVIGSGASGKVYKAVLSNGEFVAVKKLWRTTKMESGAAVGVCSALDDGFDAEVATLGKIRHKNIVKLWCCCSHKDCKLLVYEYMPNGSLGDLLHSNKAGLLDWPARYKIAVDAAEGLSYLHHDCVPPIVHRDVKSNNILLDAEFRARVADFGVAKFCDSTVDVGTKSMSVVAGSCGYIAPEYAYTLRVNEKSDIYSFGVVILELVTGKRPVDPEFGEKDLVRWVSTTAEQRGVDGVIDPKLDTSHKEELEKVLDIGILCTSSLPINRPSMRRVVKMLQEVVQDDTTTGRPKVGKLSSYYDEDTSDHGSAA